MNRIDQIALEAVRAESLSQLEGAILSFIAGVPAKEVKPHYVGLINKSGEAGLAPSSVALILFEKYCKLWMGYNPHMPVANAVTEFLENYGTWHHGLKEIALWRSCAQNGAPAEQIPKIEEFAGTMISYANDKLSS